MSNVSKPPFVAQHSIPAGVQATRWWWVRHAPVREDGGCIYGQRDLGCDTSEAHVFNAVAKMLPQDSVWYSSKLKRTHQTARAVWDAGFPEPQNMLQDEDLNEQHLGDWQGLNRAEFFASRPIPLDAFWFAPINERAPNGESFIDLYERVARAIERINVEHAGRDIIAVAHGGTIKAAIGYALNKQPERGLPFTIDNCSVTRLDFLDGQASRGWRIPMVNQMPWITDPAMHGVPSSTKLA